MGVKMAGGSLKLGQVALGLGLLAVAAPATAAVTAIRFTAMGTITYSDGGSRVCDPGICPSGYHLPEMGTPWTLHATIRFNEPVPATGRYYAWDHPILAPDQEYHDLDEWGEEWGPADHTVHFKLETQGPWTHWGNPSDENYPYYWDIWGRSSPLKIENGRPLEARYYEIYWDGHVQIFEISGNEFKFSRYWYYYPPGETVMGSGYITNFSVDLQQPVPEPASWAMMIGGFGLVGLAARRRRNMLSKL